MPKFVTISRRWNQPEISIDVDGDGIDIKMKMEDFIQALKLELGSPLNIITKKQLSKRVSVAANAVLGGIKKETVKIIR